MGVLRRDLIALPLLALLIALPFLPPFNHREDLVRWLVAAMLIAAQAMCFDLSSGFINVANFGFAAFVGLGAYTSALLVVGLGMSPWIAMFFGMIPAGLVGFLTGLLTLRHRGLFAAMVAWFVGIALMGLARNLVDLTRGSLGLTVPLLFESTSNRPYYFVLLVMTVVIFVLLTWLTRSHIGLAFRAIGQNMEAARASGINPTRYRVLNFTVSCALAGWLGGFYAHYYGILTPDVMSTQRSIQVLAAVYIGGRGSLWGGAAAAFPLIFLMNWLRSTLSNLPGLDLILYGLLLILVMIYYPGGIAQGVGWLSAQVRRWTKRSGPIVAGGAGMATGSDA
jgi:branched-chain amino acid transport system permease protein